MPSLISRLIPFSMLNLGRSVKGDAWLSSTISVVQNALARKFPPAEKAPET